MENNFLLLDNMVEPLRKNLGESDVHALQRILLDRAIKGWEIVDVCGDELGMPMLVFHKSTAMPEYAVEEVSVASGQEEIQAVTEKLWQKAKTKWLPACILNNLLATPILVFKKDGNSRKHVRVKTVVLPLKLFENMEKSIAYELLDQQVKNDLTLSCVMHGGIHPVLVLTSRADASNWEYLVEHAQGGVFSPQINNLSDLIQERATAGWQVCGTFVDAFLWPCAIFKRVSEPLLESVAA